MRRSIDHCGLKGIRSDGLKVTYSVCSGLPKVRSSVPTIPWCLQPGTKLGFVDFSSREDFFPTDANDEYGQELLLPFIAIPSLIIFYRSNVNMYM